MLLMRLMHQPAPIGRRWRGFMSLDATIHANQAEFARPDAPDASTGTNRSPLALMHVAGCNNPRQSG
jgi:hypothetical protein